MNSKNVICTEKMYKELRKNVKDVKNLLSEVLKINDMKFFIAGGSVFSILNNNSYYKDIDVYLYNEEDSNKINSALKNINYIYKTKKAITFDLYIPYNNLSKCIEFETKIQIIIKSHGEITDVLNTFDFNSSKCAFTSDNKLVFHDSFTNVLNFNPNRFNAASYKRLKKYKKKGAINYKSILKEYIEYNILNYNELFEDVYDPDIKIKGFNALISGLLLNSCDRKIFQHVHDFINLNLSKEEKLDVFYNILNYFIIVKFMKHNIKNPCNEFKLFIALRYDKFKKFASKEDYIYDLPKEYKDVMYIYPEYFI